MQTHRTLSWAAAAGAMLAGCVFVISIAQGETAEPFHRDAGAVEQAALDATRGYLRNDLDGAGAAMRRLGSLSRRLVVEDESVFGQDMVSYEAAYRLTLNEAREFAAVGNQASSFDRFVWVLRACSRCHGLRQEASPNDGARPGAVRSSHDRPLPPSAGGTGAAGQLSQSRG